MDFHWSFIAAGTGVGGRRAGRATSVSFGFVGLERFPIRARLFPEVSGFLSLAFFSKLVRVVFFLMNGYDFDISAANEHAILVLKHFCELGGYLNNCLPRKLPMLKYQT